MKIGSFDTSSITNPLSNAASAIEKKVEAKLESAVDTVKTAEAKVENFARSEYQEVKDFAKVTGQKVEQKIESAVDTVKHAAKELPSFRVPQGVKDLGKKVFGEAPKPKEVEGGANLDIKNGGKSDEKVDLNDKAKFLSAWGQKDDTEDTRSDGARCQSNTIIAGLLMKGGPEEVKAGLGKALAKAKEEQAAETDPNRKKALERAVTNLQSAVDGLEKKTVTRGQLDRAADALFTVMTPARDGEKAQFDADGDPVGGIKGADKDKIRDMEKRVGLTDGSEATKVGEKFFAPLTDDNREVSDNVWEKIQPGKAAHVSVNLYGEHKATGVGLKPDDKVQYTSKGEPYMLKPNGDYEFLNKQAQHAVLFGKNADGTRYIYNPIGEPPYISEKPGDKASSEKLDQMAANLMGVKPTKDRDSNDWQADVTTY